MKNKAKIITGGVVGAVVAALGLTGSAEAWGPERPIFTNRTPAGYITFNSIKDDKEFADNMGLGDERNFVRVREAGTSNPFTDAVDVVPGKQYEVYIYYHNDAASNLNLTAKDVRLYTYFPGVIAGKTGEDDVVGTVGAKISASNAIPRSVWDEASFNNTSANGVMLEYVEGSMRLHNASLGQGSGGYAFNSDAVAQMFMNGGGLLGYSSLNGEIPGCAEYSGYITYKVAVNQAQITMSKMVSKDEGEDKNYYDIISANVGDTVYYKVLIENSGSESFAKLVGHDYLPTGLERVGSAKMKGRVGGTDVVRDLDNFLGEVDDTQNQVLGGSLAAGGKLEITYSAKITEEALNGFECQSGKTIANRIYNGAYVAYQLASEPDLGGLIANHAAVVVSKSCPVTEVPHDHDEPEEATEMPKTGANAKEMIMMMLTSIAVVGACSYVIYGLNLARRKPQGAEAWDEMLGVSPSVADQGATGDMPSAEVQNDGAMGTEAQSEVGMFAARRRDGRKDKNNKQMGI